MCLNAALCVLQLSQGGLSTNILNSKLKMEQRLYEGISGGTADHFWVKQACRDKEPAGKPHLFSITSKSLIKSAATFLWRQSAWQEMALSLPSYLQLLPPCQAVPGDLPCIKSASIDGSARDHQQRWGHPSPPALWEIALKIELCQEQPGVKWSVCWAPQQDLIPSEVSIFPLLLLMFARDGGNQCNLPCGLEQSSSVWMCSVSSSSPKQMDPCLHCPAGKIPFSRWTQLSLE